MKTKRIILCLLCLVLAVSFASCGKKKSNSNNVQKSTVVPMTKNVVPGDVKGEDQEVLKKFFLLDCSKGTVEKLEEKEHKLKEGTTDMTVNVSACVKFKTADFQEFEEVIKKTYNPVDNFTAELETFNNMTGFSLDAGSIIGAYHRFDNVSSGEKYEYTARKVLVITKSGEEYKVYFMA